ncbi:MFS transporter [Acidiplasma cupricumulans]|uniref:MFS transporter n=1 Tax=Acidiplasma cupricumulans TaxID=312540 RepID=UPI000781DABD|nr:MFS transporter [Acidiplasma cupricumulans]
MEKYWRYTLSAFFGVLLFAFDFEMFLASIPGLIALFNFNLNDINIINDTAFIVSAIAAFSFGYLADKYGRRLLFMITVLLYSFGSLITGFSFSVPTFMFSRGLTSVGAGTDEPLGFTLTAETAPHKLRGRQMLITSLGFPVGQTFGAAVVYLFELYNIHLTYVFFYRRSARPVHIIFQKITA